MDLDLAGHTYVVTGGSSGIGLACVEALADEGANVLAAARTADQLAVAGERCAAKPGRVETLAIDVTAPEAGTDLVAAADSMLGGFDGLVNSAGSTRVRDLERAADIEWRQQWELDVMAPKRAMDAAAPLLADRGGGAIVNVCSSAGRKPSSRDPVYAVSKRGEIALTQVYAERYRSSKVRISAVAPGPTETELWMAPGGLLDEVAAEPGARREQTYREQAARLPLGRLARPTEIAAVILMLLSPRAPAAAATWSVDGGHVPDVFP
jgi:3-oxoacyl-[acyl-carrier protein] reductase